MTEYVCYILKSQTNPNRTYVGITNNFKRRIRQHNGDLKHGGARYTKAHRPWKPLLKVKGFKTKRAALRFEWAMKHRARRRKGASSVERRLLTLRYLLSAPSRESTAEMIKQQSLRVKCSFKPGLLNRVLGKDAFHKMDHVKILFSSPKK